MWCEWTNDRCHIIGGGCKSSEASIHVNKNGRLKGRIAKIAKELHGTRVQKTKESKAWGCREYTCLRHSLQGTPALVQDVERLGDKAVGHENNVGRDEGGGEAELRGGWQAAANVVDCVSEAEGGSVVAEQMVGL